MNGVLLFAIIVPLSTATHPSSFFLPAHPKIHPDPPSLPRLLLFRDTIRTDPTRLYAQAYTHARAHSHSHTQMCESWSRDVSRDNALSAAPFCDEQLCVTAFSMAWKEPSHALLLSAGRTVGRVSVDGRVCWLDVSVAGRVCCMCVCCMCVCC